MSNKITDYSYTTKKEQQRKLLNVILFFVFSFIIINLIISFLIYPVKQVSSSMNPDFPENSLLMVSPIYNNIERGDVVLVNTSAEKTEMNFFKKCVNVVVRFFTAQQISPYENKEMPCSNAKLRRIVGMPGDTCYMRDYVMYIKPAGSKHYLTEFEITEKSYNVTFYVAPGGWDSSIGVKGSFEEIELGPNEYFVLGDNRKACDDSRLWGAVSKNSFAAKTLFCYFPFKNIKLY